MGKSATDSSSSDHLTFNTPCKIKTLLSIQTKIFLHLAKITAKYLWGCIRIYSLLKHYNIEI